MALTLADLEKLRENSGISLDREGRFWHEGAPVEHPKIAALFHRGLGRAPDGRPNLTVGRTWCYVDAPGPLYQVRELVLVEEAGYVVSAIARLDDETEEAVDLATCVLDPDGVVLVRVKGGAEWGRFSSAAQRSLSRYVGEDGRLAWRGRSVELIGKS